MRRTARSGSIPTARAAVVVLSIFVSCLLVVRSTPARAQLQAPPPALPPGYAPPLQRDRPFSSEPDLSSPSKSSLDVEAERRARVLPALPAPSIGELEALGARAGLVVRELVVEGNTVFSDAALTAAVATHLGRPLDSADLERLRRALTAVYVEAGYVSSGASLPEQSVEAGRLRVVVSEGVLSEIRILGTERYRAETLRARLARAAGPPVRVGELEGALRILAQDPRIERLDARLEPGATAGSSILHVVVDEADPADLAFSFDNYETASVGDFAGHVDVAHRNPLGIGDAFDAGVTVAEGLQRVGGRYSIPLHPSGTELVVQSRFSHVSITDSILSSTSSDILRLEIVNESATHAVGLEQTLYRSPADWITAGLALHMRRSRSTLDGNPFSFSDGLENGRGELTVLRSELAWTHRMRASALSLRSTASFGLDALGATIQHGDGASDSLPPEQLRGLPDDLPDAIFTTWVGQLRYIRRLERGGIELGVRGDIQLSDKPLLPLEQFAIGGPGSVRGYQTNRLAGDQGFAAGLDVRVPLWRTATGRSLVSMIPFADVGQVWNRSRPDRQRPTLASLGAALEWQPHPTFLFRLDWGGAFHVTDHPKNLQDRGVNFRVVWSPR